MKICYNQTIGRNKETGPELCGRDLLVYCDDLHDSWLGPLDDIGNRIRPQKQVREKQQRKNENNPHVLSCLLRKNARDGPTSNPSPRANQDTICCSWWSSRMKSRPVLGLHSRLASASCK